MSQRWRSRSWVFPLVSAVALIATCGAAVQHQHRRATWRTALADHQESRDLVAEIKQLEATPQLSASDAESSRKMSTRIHEIAAETLPSQSIVSVQPSLERQLRSLPWSVQPTQIEFQEATLAELASFIAQLEDASQALVVNELRLLDVVSDGSTERWSGDLKLTQTVHSANVRRQQQP